MGLLDLLRKPKDQTLTVHGVVGTQLQQGMINEEYNQDLVFPQSVEIYDEMRKSDGTVIAILRAIKQPLISAKWQLQDGGDEERDKEIAEFVRKNLFEKVKFKHFLRESLGFLDFGFYYFEKVFEVVDGKIEWKSFSPRIPRAHYIWNYQEAKEWVDGHPMGVTQQVNSLDESNKTTFRKIPWDKIILFSFEKEGNNFEGVSVLRNAYKHYFYKDLLYKLGSISAERYGSGVPTAKIKGSTTSANKLKIIEFLKNIRSNEQSYGVYTDDVEDLKILTPDGSGIDMQPQIDHHDRKIYDSILAGFLNLTTGEGGSNALSKDQSSFFLRGLQGVADMWIDTVNEHIKELVDMNYNGVVNYPTLTVADIGSISMDEQIGAISTAITGAMIELNQNDKNDIRAILKLSPLPNPDEGDVELDKIEMELDLEQMQINTLEGFAGQGEEMDPGSPQEMAVDKKMSEIFEESYEYGKPLSAEHKAKIAKAIEDLKNEPNKIEGADVKGQTEFIEGDKQVQGYEAQRQQLKSMSDNVKLAMDNLKAKKASMSKEDKKKFAKEFKAKIDEMRNTRLSLQKMGSEIKTKQKERGGFLKNYRNDVVSKVKAAKKENTEKIRAEKKAARDLERETKKKAREEERAKKKAEKEAKKSKSLATPEGPMEREVVFTHNITDFESFLEDKYDEAEELVIQAQEEYKEALEDLYDESENQRIDGVICLVYDKKMINKGQKLVEKITAKLQAKLIDGPLQKEIFEEAMKKSIATLGDNEKNLADKIEVKRGQIDTFIEGYKSNMQGVIYNESRRVLENITLNYGSEASVDLAKKTADISINKNILSLSFITHPRALYKYVIYTEAQKQGFTLFKTLVPTDKLPNVIDRPFGMTAGVIFTIQTAAQINKTASAATAGATAEAVTGLGLHHGSFEYYYPISSADLDVEEGIAKKQRADIQTKMDLEKDKE